MSNFGSIGTLEFDYGEKKSYQEATDGQTSRMTIASFLKERKPTKNDIK